MKPKKKVCGRCRSIKSGWTCRHCGAVCCAHLCYLKDGKVATCSACSITGRQSWNPNKGTET